MFEHVIVLDAVVLTCVAAYVAIVRNRRNANRLPKPPGPKGLPIIGNALDMPKSHLWEKAVEWGKTYGDIVFLESFGHPMLFLNSYESAVDLLEKRSLIYSSRPPLVMANELEGFDWMLVFLPYGERLRKYRMLFHRFFQASVIPKYQDLKLRETRKMLSAIVRAPEKYDELIRSYPGAVIMMNVYGYEVSNTKDPYIQMAEACIEEATGVEDYFFLDYFPWLRYLPEWFPGGGFQKTAREARQLSHDMQFNAHEMTKKKMQEGHVPVSMTSILLDENTDEKGVVTGESDIAASAAMAYAGGADTTSTTLMTFILAMLLYPDAQRRAHEELDRVVGKDCLPTFDDRKSLPYIRAICSETLRWEGIAPLATAHTTTSDDVYRGYLIPAGTTVFPNLWAMLRNEDMFPEPQTFKPERWLSDSGNVGPIAAEKIAFGFGRRICPGQDWAEAVVFIAVSSLLATFNIEKAIGPDGKPIPPNTEFLPKFVRRLGPSKCTFTPRSAKIVEVIRNSLE